MWIIRYENSGNPFLINLNQDPLFSETVIYPLVEKQTRFGRGDGCVRACVRACRAAHCPQQTPSLFLCIRACSLAHRVCVCLCASHSLRL
jgi:hypothetical protein